MLLLRVIARAEVGVDPLGDITKQRLQTRRWIKLWSFAGLPERCLVRLLRLPPSLLGAATCGLRIVEVHFALRDPRFNVVELRVKNADLPKVAPFESLQLRAKLRQLRFPLGQHRTNRRKPLAPVKKRSVVRGFAEG